MTTQTHDSSARKNHSDVVDAVSAPRPSRDTMAARIPTVAQTLRHAGVVRVITTYGDGLCAADLERRLHRYLGSASAKHAASRLIDPLSAREVEVLQRIAGGSSNSAIAEQLCISENTVKFHVKNIYAKLGANNRAGVIVAAQRCGYLLS